MKEWNLGYIDARAGRKPVSLIGAYNQGYLQGIFDELTAWGE